LRAYG